MSGKEEKKTPWGFRLLMGATVYLLLAALFFWIISDAWSRTVVSNDPVNRDSILPELTGETEIAQTFTMDVQRLTVVRLQAAMLPSDGREHHVALQILDGDRVLTEEIRKVSELPSDGTLELLSPVLPEDVAGKRMTLKIRGDGGISFWYGTTRSTGKFSVNAEIREQLTVNGIPVDGELVLYLQGVKALAYTRYFWPVALALLALVLGLAVYLRYRRMTGRLHPLNRAADLMRQYQYLLKTLVVRDFKVRYKASMLGVVWSFLNPLLMTMVYFFVFSTIFQSSIPNFPVYLMSGIVLFNYFSEATNMAMQSIVGNAGLITKVYMPKYIFPVSKVLSSAINLVISLIPLLLMMALTGVSFEKSLLLMPVLIGYLVVFCIGMGLILSACMVYFRDIQFLWGIVLTILNFFSPIFYPESIIPARFAVIYHMNPLYQYLFFMRTITLGGVSPTPVTYLYCTVASTAALALGLIVFHRAQSRFVLHL